MQLDKHMNTNYYNGYVQSAIVISFDINIRLNIVRSLPWHPDLYLHVGGLVYTSSSISNKEASDVGLYRKHSHCYSCETPLNLCIMLQVG